MKFNFNKQLLIAFWLIALFPAVSGQGLSGFEKEISEKFRKYVEAFPREEIFIHTDRDEYIAGEELWFSAYLVDRQSNKPSEHSSLAYLEIYNTQNNAVAFKRFKVEDGSGSGEILLPDSLSTGKYIIRAYTSWMKNFLPANCFMKVINIYNALGAQRNISDLFGSARILTDTLNNQISRPASASGIQLKAVRKNESLEIIVVADNDFRFRNGNSCFLFIETHGIMNHVTSLRLTGENTVYTCPGNILIPGVNHITLFDSRGQPVCEKFVYRSAGEAPGISLTLPESVGKREKISLGLSSGSSDPTTSGLLNVSVSVTPRTGYHDMTDAAGYLVFGSEFGIVPDEIRKGRIDELQPSVVDKFLENAVSSWIDWDMIISGKYTAVEYKMEKEEHYLNGKLINKDTRKPESNKYLFLSTPSKNAGFQYAKTDAGGNFTFTIPVRQGVRDIIIQPEEASKNRTIEILPSFAEKHPFTGKIPAGSEKELPYYITKWSTNYQVNRIYGTSHLKETKAPADTSAVPRRFYGKPDIELVMDDYIKLPVMQEVFFELLPGVKMKNARSNYEIIITDPIDSKVLIRPPIMFIDGVVIYDPAIIASLDPDLVEEIDVIKQKYFVGDYLFYGLINVVTRAGDFSVATLPDFAVRLKYRVFDLPSSFTVPDYSYPGKSKTIPDFRNTLYWNPSVKIAGGSKTLLEFPASDYDGEYEIIIQGMTGEGQPLSTRKTFKIK